MQPAQIPADVRIGHIHLKVADIPRAVAFYRDLLGFDLLFEMDDVAFLSAGGYHHHIGLNTWTSPGGTPPGRSNTGLYHFALNYPTSLDLSIAVRRLVENDWPIDGASDHYTHIAVYTHDPDRNGIELAVDADPARWASIKDITAEDFPKFLQPLDVAALLAESEGR
ncbi:MAG: VOC family protein [Armatimonadetes bacterium]|nr:VOC family protein [Armatimonadota bacterium]